MTKRETLHRWLLDHGEWVYFSEIPRDLLNVSPASLSSAIRDLCTTNRADFRIVGLTQYRGKLSPQQLREAK